MDFYEKVKTIRTVLGDDYMVFDTFDALNMTYTLRIDRKDTMWHIKMSFRDSDIMRMGDNFIGAVCRSVVSEYAEFITRYRD